MPWLHPHAPRGAGSSGSLPGRLLWGWGRKEKGLAPGSWLSFAPSSQEQPLEADDRSGAGKSCRAPVPVAPGQSSAGTFLLSLPRAPRGSSSK